jgi:uncharacterized protein
MPDLTPGTPVHIDFRKWDGSEHWQLDAYALGADDLGTWLGTRAGSRVQRPGVEIIARCDLVLLLPHGSPWAATFYDRSDPAEVQVYVDITTEAEWFETEQPVRVRLVDLDLDVVRRGETTYLDDEDEFAEHQVRYGYPTDVIERCEQTAAEVLQQVTHRTGPFAPECADGWFAALRDLNG